MPCPRRCSVCVWTRQQALWGHSLAGLFVLHALYAGDGWFTDFVAASPSLCWGQCALLGEPERCFLARGLRGAARLWLWLCLGGAERAWQLAARLSATPGLAVHYREFPALHHVAVFQAALRAALREVIGPRARGEGKRRG